MSTQKRNLRRIPRRSSLPEKGKPPRFRYLFPMLGAAIVITIISYLVKFYSAPPEFDGHHAFQYLTRQCQFGSRVPGSAAHRQCGDFLVAELEKYADHLWEQGFSYRDKKDSTRVLKGRNIIASFNINPRRNFRVLLCAHWDSRPWADQDRDSTKHNQPVPGANDGASGVAVLLEMARILKQHPLSYGVDIILFDLEDSGDYGAEQQPVSRNPFCIGSDYFVNYSNTYRPSFGILLDMVGDRNLRIPKEGFSVENAPEVVNLVWSAAKRINARAFVDETGNPVIDDHFSFLQKGYPVIDLIDFDYPYWHTTEDTPDKCSAESLEEVGRVLVEVLYRY